MKPSVKKGDRIRLISMNDPQPIPPGTTGTVTDITHLHDGTQISVNWDIKPSRSLMLAVPPDKFEVIP